MLMHDRAGASGPSGRFGPGPPILIGLTAVAALVHVGTLFPAAWALYQAVPANGRPVILGVSVSLVIAVIACALAILLVVRAGNRYEARGLAFFLVLIAICWGSVLRFASLDRGPDGSVTGLDVTVSGMPLLLATFTLALAAAALLDLSLRFPEDLISGNGGRRLIGRRWVPWALALTAPLLIQPGISLVGNIATAFGIQPETMVRLLPWALGTVAAIIGSVVLGMLGLAVANFIRGYRLADAESRRSALWLLVGVVGSALVVLTSAVALAADMAFPVSLGLLTRYMPLIVFFAPLFMLIGIAVSILYSGAVDPRLALRRSTINGIAGFVGLTVFAGLENVLSAWVENRLGLPGTVGSFLAGALAAGVFVPVRRGLERSGVERMRTSERRST